MKKVMWFSRHTLTDAQADDLRDLFGDIEVAQVNRTVSNAFELKAEIEEVDIVAVVMPIHLQEQTLRIAGERPVLICRSHRVQAEDGTFEFIHAGWDRLEKIDVVKHTLSDHPKPDGSIR